MNNIKFFVETIGCQMNVNDSNEISQYLLSCGCTKVSQYQEADLIILNTCSVRELAEHKAYSFLGRLGEQKKINPNLIIGVVGCMAQHATKKIKQK